MRADDILDEAKEVIADRGKDYGLAALNHLRIAKLWSAYLERDIEPHEVAICMALVKVSRLQETPHHADSYKDGAAYIALAGQIASTDWADLDSY
jgi:hypothetical protein